MNGQPVGMQYNNRLYFIHSDHLDTPRAITDQWNTPVWRWRSKPFGDSPPEQDPDGDGQSITFNLRFPGQYFDEETGFYYNYFRTYDPGSGRYLESDPIGLDGGLNTYTYVDSNPITHIDPTGELLWFLVPVFVGGGGTAAGGAAVAGGVSWGTAILGGIGLGVLMSIPGDTSQTQAGNRQAEYQRMKDRWGIEDIHDRE